MEENNIDNIGVIFSTKSINTKTFSATWGVYSSVLSYSALHPFLLLGGEKQVQLEASCSRTQAAQLRSGLEPTL